MTIVEFLTARLDEREHAAKTCADAFPSPWDLSDRGWMAKVSADAPAFRTVAELEQSKTLDGEGWVGDYLQHIAFHDPARVLADVAAKRAIIAEHASGFPGQTNCIACASGDENGADWPCVTIRYLASVDADHPDFREEWALA